MTRTAAVLFAAASASIALAGDTIPQRDVQFRSVDLANGVIELHNFGAAAMPLDGWRFCTHSNAVARRYTTASALNGVSIDAGGSLFIYMNNDAPKGDANFNASQLGSFATNFGQGPYALQLFWPNGGSLSFGATDDMVDHAQWSVAGVNNPIAQTRSQQAVNAGIWTAATDWIVTTGNTVSFSLAPAGGELHGPADYTVSEPNPSCNPADISAPFDVLDLADISAFVAAFTSSGAAADLAAPFGVFDLSDISTFIGAFTAGCP